MSGTLLSHYLRGIFEEARETRLLTSPRRPSPASEILAMSPLHLPEVRSPAQYLIDMGLRPALARRISSVYMDFVARYIQIFESHFCRTIHGSCLLNPEYYRNIFVIRFKGTIQVLASRIMSNTWVWLSQTGQLPASVCSLDVRSSSPAYMVFRN